MRIEQVDKIILTYKEYEEISNWVQSQKFDNVDITLNEGIVIMSDILHRGFSVDVGIYFRIDEKTGDILIQQYDIESMTPTVTANIDERFFSNGYIDIQDMERLGKLINKDNLEKSIKVSLLTILDIFQYMNHYREHVVVKKETKNVRSMTRVGRAKNKKSNIVSLKSKRYSFTKTDDVVARRSNYNRQMNNWSVKGHWRQYQSGIRVWIKPHTRGDGEVKEGKTYKKMG